MIEDQSLIRMGVIVERGDEVFEILDVDDIQCKAPSDANWHPALVYRSLAAGDNIRRVRPITDFCNKFSLVEDLEDEEEE